MNDDLTSSSPAIVPEGMFLTPELEPGELPADAVRRELEEEIGLRIGAGAFTFVGRFEGPAVNEDGTVVANAFASIRRKIDFDHQCGKNLILCRRCDR